MNAAIRITPEFIAKYYMMNDEDMVANDSILTYRLSKHLPDHILLIVRWVYENHNDFLEEYIEHKEDRVMHETTREEIKAFLKKKDKKAKELKSSFPHIKQYNELYHTIIVMLKPIILKDNE